MKINKPELLLLFSLVMIVSLSSCKDKSRLSITTNSGDISEKSASVTASELPDASAAPIKTAAPTLSPVREIDISSQLNTDPPFDETAFLINPYEDWNPAKGEIFTSLPDGAIVKVWIRFYDSDENACGIFQHVSVQNKRIKYEFELPPAVPAQFILLEASYIPDDIDYPQDPAFSSLFGAHGEKLASPPAFVRPDGGFYLMEQWSVAYPDLNTAENSELSEWEISMGGRVMQYGYDNDIFVVELDMSSTDDGEIDMDTFFEICIDQTQKYLRRTRRFSYYKNPAICFIDLDDNVLCEYGTDPLIQTTEIHPVYISSGGAKYHESDCKYASGSDKIPITIAEIKGYAPCKVCH